MLLILVFALSLSIGAIPISFKELWNILFTSQAEASQNSLVIWQIRMPRTLLGVMAGAVLAICGVAMQGLFRNPLADPGLIGVSSGAALGAGIAIVFGASLTIPLVIEPYLLSIFAFLGGIVVTWLVYRLGLRNGRTDVATMLLAGVAITALSGAGIGLLAYIADDSMLRKLTFWNMGSLNGAIYPNLWPLLIVTIAICIFLPFRANGLNALLLGESEARHLGVNVERIKVELIVCTALGVGTAVAATGMIGFIGLVVPHLIRLVAGPNHRILLPASAIAGACLLLLADIVARVVLAPAELQIGIVTALLGAPFFLYLLMRRRF
ncbi:FecCD family ABC transporter permease [Entomomonas asaccharolytica]|uniref:FecCD family ABC transporter permease n=1 Tax=Entomomonas asaccharolytica TaxID=2785331 RepID=UPI00362E46FD